MTIGAPNAASRFRLQGAVPVMPPCCPPMSPASAMRRENRDRRGHLPRSRDVLRARRPLQHRYRLPVRAGLRRDVRVFLGTAAPGAGRAPRTARAQALGGSLASASKTRATASPTSAPQHESGFNGQGRVAGHTPEVVGSRHRLRSGAGVLLRRPAPGIERTGRRYATIRAEAIVAEACQAAATRLPAWNKTVHLFDRAPKVRRTCSSVEASSSWVASRVASPRSQRRVAVRLSRSSIRARRAAAASPWRCRRESREQRHGAATRPRRRA